MQHYTVADIFIRLKNAALARRKSVEFIKSKRAEALLNIMQAEGYISGLTTREEGSKKFLVANITRHGKGSVFTDVKIISKPSLRVYADKSDIEKMQRKSIGQVILSTSKGIMTGKKALETGVGGEVLVEVW